MKTRYVPTALPPSSVIDTPTPRQQRRPLGALLSLFAQTPVVDSENDVRFRGRPTIRPCAFLMTAGG
ncbi:MAG TPA: hypothetical protein VF438_03280 [Candidatus Paceibacterota bacterium]